MIMIIKVLGLLRGGRLACMYLIAPSLKISAVASIPFLNRSPFLIKLVRLKGLFEPVAALKFTVKAKLEETVRKVRVCETMASH